MNRRRIAALTAAAAVLSCMFSCADDTPPATVIADCDSDGDCPGPEVCDQGECVLEILPPDAEQEPPEPDASEPDMGMEPDVAPDDPDIGDPCDESDDCTSGYCIEVAESDGQRICTDFCDPGDATTCPDGFVCSAVINSGADRVFLCFPEADFLCQDCTTDLDCGGLSDLCLSYPGGAFCGRSCQVRECPEGFDCVEVEGPDGPSDQCRISTGFCSDCFDPDGDRYGEGDACMGLDCDENDVDRNAGEEEVCNGVDDDCDDLIDEEFDLQSDPNNCGGCGNTCVFEGAEALCVEAQCALGDCREDRFDIDGLPENGCEYFCQDATEEVCNGADDDCDGLADEDFDVQSDVLNCGGCGQACALPNAIPSCVDRQCQIESCADELHFDLNNDPEDGCEYACVRTNGGVEACDNIDNDCDGAIDEDFDLQSDPLHCGGCGDACEGVPNRVQSCVRGACEVGDCLDGFVDVDGVPENGCEYACSPQNGGVEVCNGVDDNCDGDIDEGVLNACGECGPVPAEVCDGQDNDCNGSVDDGQVCGPYVQSQCRIFAGWADRSAGPNGASNTWGVCPTADRNNNGDVRCVGTRRDGRFARLQLPGDVNSDDEVAVALLCNDNNNTQLAQYIQTHCALYLGHADNRQGVDRSPAWGDCPPAASGDNGRQRCTSSGFDRRFRAVRLVGDVNGDDHLGLAWICRDDADPARAAALESSVSVYLGWADRNEGAADGSATWGPCPGRDSGTTGGQRCISTQGDGLFHLMELGGDVNDDDQLGWALRAR